MKFLWLLLVAGAHSFAPAPLGRTTRIASDTSRSFGLDPHVFHDLPTHVDTLSNAFSSLSLADADVAVDAAASAGDVAAAAGSSNGWFGFLAVPIEGLLTICHDVLVSVGLSENSWGISILFMTTIIKLVTFPLTKTQLESTNKMQALQPKIKATQAKYQSNPEVMNQKIAELYQSNDVNPLAGCLPSFAQIPIFIGLYRAVLALAKENALDEPFLFLPNLEGPTYGADPTHGSDWILKGWVDGVPSLGWEDTTAFLILPVFLVISQFASMQLMQPQPGPDGNAPEQPFVLKLLPLMIGWFSLNVPAALCIYWVANNVITTATTVGIRNSMKTEMVGAAGDGASTTAAPTGSVFASTNLRDEPAGFANAFAEDPDIKPITAVDVEVTSLDDEGDEASAGGGGMEAPKSPKKRGKKKKKKGKN